MTPERAGHDRARQAARAEWAGPVGERCGAAGPDGRAER